MTNVENYKNSKFTKNRPERLWPFKLWINYNKQMWSKLTQDLVKIQKCEISFLCGAYGKSEAWHMDQSMLKTEVGLRGVRSS